MSRTCGFRDYNMAMSEKLNVRAIRQRPDAGAHWVAAEVDGGYMVRCDDAVLVTVNGQKPRLFKNLDTLAKKLKEEIGITSFEVVTRG